MRVTGSIAIAAALLLTASAQANDRWTRDFPLEPQELTATGRNPWFILEPGYQLVYRDGTEELTITVLPATKIVSGVETRVVEERETRNGALVEVSHNYFAISRRTNSVFYFGEDVDMYKDGKVVSHEGAWLAGVNGARHGLMMPGLPLIGARYYQEIAEGTAMDRAEIVGLNERVTTPAGSFTGVVKIDESTPLERGVKETKWHARGIGMVQDGSMKLIRYGPKTAG